MGCICSKGAKDYDDENQKLSSTKNSKRGEAVEAEGNNGNGFSISKPPSQENLIPIPVTLDLEDQKSVAIGRGGGTHQRRATVDIEYKGGGGGGAGGKHHQQPFSRAVSLVPNGVKGEQIAAGWPIWLTSVAAEAIQGWVPRKADSFEKLDKIGQGTYSNVYKARDLETGKMVALKKVRFVNMDPESVRFMAREIHILRKLDHPNIVKLEGLITSRMSSSLYLVFEYMEHDLAGLSSSPGTKFTEPQVRFKSLLDNNGILRIADFGLATTFTPNQTQPLTSRVVTLWYRPPELLLGTTEYGVAVDLWSSGCILAELFAGKPIMPGRTEVEQLHKIFKLCGSPADDYWKKKKLPHATIFKPQHPYKRCIGETFKSFPATALALLDILLAIEPEDRGTASSALKSDFFTTKPLPCDPSSLPKYAPSKEFDVKLRDAEARRQKGATGKGRGSEAGKDKSKDSKADMQGQANPKSNTQEEGGTSLNIEGHKGTAQIGSTNHIGNKIGYGSTTNGGPELRSQRSYMHQAVDKVSNLTARSTAQWDNPRHRSTDAHRLGPQLSIHYDNFDDAEPFVKGKWNKHGAASTQKKDEKVFHKDSMQAYAPKKSRMHYSGPLMPPGGNIEEMLKEHERQIQQAVRKARLGKAKSKEYGDESDQTESLNGHRKIGR
ncbi:hypothetical protein MKW92_034916 [Papaver armeniacum]|nr:hypothetical protein MKW92_034916 [Papaver armeniacum]